MLDREIIFLDDFALRVMARIARRLGARADQDEVFVAGVVELVKMFGRDDHHLARTNHILGAFREMKRAFPLRAIEELIGRVLVHRPFRPRIDSMMPMMKDGWLLFYHRDQDGVPDDCIGKLCVVKVADDGPALVKEVRRGSRANSFNLLSVNADPIEDVILDWAARVISIRPV
jgi:hypothetical protein